MQTVRSPYTEIQAIRRQLKDRGILTYPRWFTYQLILDVSAATSVTPAIGRTKIHPDSYFVWVSSAWYSQDRPIDGNLNPILSDGATQNAKFPQWEWSLKVVGSNRRFHSPEWTTGLWFDNWQGTDTPGSGSAAIYGDVPQDAATTTVASIWRSFLPAVVLFDPNTTIEARARRNPDGSPGTDQGMIVSLHGARLFRRP